MLRLREDCCLAIAVAPESVANETLHGRAGRPAAELSAGGASRRDQAPAASYRKDPAAGALDTRLLEVASARRCRFSRTVKYALLFRKSRRCLL
jgi:hypothetical protein